MSEKTGSGGEIVSNKIIKDAKLNTDSGSKKKKSEPARLQQTTGGSVGISAKGVLLTIGAVCVVFGCAYVAYDQLSPKVALTIEDSNGKTSKYSMKDMGYYVYEGEAQGQTYADLYAQFYGEDYDYWNQQDDNGVTTASTTADSIMEEATEDFILYLQATADGYTATEDDKSTAKENTNTALENMTTKQKMITGLSEDDIYNVLLMQQVGERYREDKITSFGLDYDDITKDITKKDYKQYDFQYYYIPTTTTDEEGNTVDLSDEEKAAAKAKMETFLTQAESAEDFATIFGNDEEGNAITTNDDGITFTADGQLLAKDVENSGFDDKLDKKITKMKANEISSVLEGTDGYYIIKLTDNTSTESYESAIDEAKQTAEDEAFEEEYTNNIEPNFTATVNYDVWDNINVGSYTI